MQLRQQKHLIESGIVTSEQMTDALESELGSKGKTLHALLQVSNVDGNAVMTSLARMYKVPLLDISAFTPGQRLLNLCTEQLCKDYDLLPIDEANGSIVVAMANPMDFTAVDAVHFKMGQKVKPIFARPDLITRKIQELYHGESDFSDAMEQLDDDDTEKEGTEDLDQLKNDAAASPVIKMVNSIFSQAIKIGSSDIHIEAGLKQSVVRLRVDGRLRPALHFPTKAHTLIVSRIKIMSQLDISNTRTPQDGRSAVKLWGKKLDLRVSTLPSVHGEKIVIRILDKSGLSLDLDLLGFEETAYARVQDCIARPTGAVLVTGPTGSGKTTTLYSFLHHINSDETNIVTVEDPVEFQIKGINQVQVNVKAGMTFAAALRSILRQDPDIVMLGEIRDKETSHIAVHAAQTGHLVLSTLHTNDAVATVSRLVEMGLEPTTLAASLNLIVAQRLLRRLCPHCKKEAPITDELKKRYDIPDNIVFYAPNGCKKCFNIGYRGRMGAHEVLFMNDRLREMISNESTEKDLVLAAREEGMYTLFEDAMNKALSGVTSLDEVLHIGVAPEGFKLQHRLSDTGKLLSLGDSKKKKAKGNVKTSDGKKRILVVDDSNSIRNLVKFVLQSDGYEVMEASDGQEAWNALQDVVPDLMISDCEMPNMTGPELVERVRSESCFDTMPIIMLTSLRDEEDEVLGLESGADDYIIKPVEPMKLQVRVRKVLSMYARISHATGAQV
ncbi:MAG: type II/IV secretion system protein [Mariprofundaceae bacterium]|nr:type II/IV secretion system protein [Mariprofundaceae bacterium]